MLFLDISSCYLVRSQFKSMVLPYINNVLKKEDSATEKYSDGASERVQAHMYHFEQIFRNKLFLKHLPILPFFLSDSNCCRHQ